MPGTVFTTPTIQSSVWTFDAPIIYVIPLNWRKSTFYPVAAPGLRYDFKMQTAVDRLWRHRYMSWPRAIVTSQWPIVFRSGSYGHFYHNGGEVSWLRILWNTCLMLSFPRFIIERIFGAVNWLVNNVIINWPRATHTVQIRVLIILQRRGSMRTMHGFVTELFRHPTIWSVESRNCVN